MSAERAMDHGSGCARAVVLAGGLMLAGWIGTGVIVCWELWL